VSECFGKENKGKNRGVLVLSQVGPPGHDALDCFGRENKEINGNKEMEGWFCYILPSRHIGSPQSMFQFCQDSNAFAAAFGPKPDLSSLPLPTPSGKRFWQHYSLSKLGVTALTLLLGSSISKWMLCWLKLPRRVSLEEHWPISITIEFQKCGLPHMHLIFLDAAAKPITPAHIDTIVCAELPYPVAESHLYNIVSKVMIHRPCGPHGNPNAVCIGP
jgi:hypothetical protein